MPYVDFADIKTRLTIEKVAELLGLQLKQSNNALRGPCPVCASGGDRAIVITPAKGVFFCFAAREGGDLIALAAHIRKVDVKDAAAWLDGGTVPSKKEGSGNQVPPKGNSSLEPLAYLEHEHVAVEALGFAAEDAKALGIGYCPKGIMRGTVAVPVRLEDGTLAGYIGITEAKLPPMAVLAALLPGLAPFSRSSAKFQRPSLPFSLLWLGWVSWWPPWVRSEPFCPASGAFLRSSATLPLSARCSVLLSAICGFSMIRLVLNKLSIAPPVPNLSWVF
jgi:hypothetical protein